MSTLGKPQKFYCLRFNGACISLIPKGWMLSSVCSFWNFSMSLEIGVWHPYFSFIFWKHGVNKPPRNFVRFFLTLTQWQRNPVLKTSKLRPLWNDIFGKLWWHSQVGETMFADWLNLVSGIALLCQLNRWPLICWICNSCFSF